MGQKRHPKGSSAGGRFACSQAPDDPPLPTGGLSLGESREHGHDTAPWDTLPPGDFDTWPEERDLWQHIDTAGWDGAHLAGVRGAMGEVWTTLRHPGECTCDRHDGWCYIHIPDEYREKDLQRGDLLKAICRAAVHQRFDRSTIYADRLGERIDYRPDMLDSAAAGMVQAINATRPRPWYWPGD